MFSGTPWSIILLRRCFTAHVSGLKLSPFLSLGRTDKLAERRYVTVKRNDPRSSRSKRTAEDIVSVWPLGGVAGEALGRLDGCGAASRRGDMGRGGGVEVEWATVLEPTGQEALSC